MEKKSMKNQEKNQERISSGQDRDRESISKEKMNIKYISMIKYMTGVSFTL